jgi:hypothetical protein
MTVKQSFIKAFNLQGDEDQNEIFGRNLVDKVSSEITRLHQLKSSLSFNDEQVLSSKLLTHIEHELIRLKQVNIPHEVLHIPDQNLGNEPQEHYTNYNKVIKAHDAVTETIWFLEEQCARFELHMISDDLTQCEKLRLIKNFVDTNELNSHTMFSLGLAIGLHNQEMYSSHFTKAGIRKVQSEQLKAIKRFDQQYGLSMKFMRDVLLDFYQFKEHHPFKPKLVIDQIENICIVYKISFPKDRNGKDYRNIYKTIMSYIPSNPDWMKKSKENYSQIDAKYFNEKYEKRLIQLLN